MKSHPFSDDFRFNGTADCRNQSIQNQESESQTDFSPDQADHRPGNQYRSCSENRQNINQGGYGRYRHRGAHPQTDEPDAQQNKGHQGKKNISPNHRKNIGFQNAAKPQHPFPGTPGQAGIRKPDDIPVIRCEITAGHCHRSQHKQKVRNPFHHRHHPGRAG